jgi:hypothetical protein
VKFAASALVGQDWSRQLHFEGGVPMSDLSVGFVWNTVRSFFTNLFSFEMLPLRGANILLK